MLTMPMLSNVLYFLFEPYAYVLHPKTWMCETLGLLSPWKSLCCSLSLKAQVKHQLVICSLAFLEGKTNQIYRVLKHIQPKQSSLKPRKECKMKRFYWASRKRIIWHHNSSYTRGCVPWCPHLFVYYFPGIEKFYKLG